MYKIKDLTCDTNTSKRKGIYLIINHANNKVYVGSTRTSFKDRWNSHLDCLRKNNHGNPYLQNAWNKYGAAMFEFKIAEDIEDDNNILEIEQYYIDVFFGKECYNMHRIAKSPNRDSTTKIAKYNLYIKSPNNELFGPILNLAKFCREHKLSFAGMSNMIFQDRPYKGWVIHRCSDELINKRHESRERSKVLSIIRYKERTINKSMNEVGYVRSVGRPTTSQETKDKVINILHSDINDGKKVSLRKIQKQVPEVNFLTIRNILMEYGLYELFLKNSVIQNKRVNK